jgi:mycoredoxin-dependent peroxiredoxin
VTLAVGAPAPEFELRDQHGQRVALTAHRGKAVALLFYPYAFSRVCSGELAGLQDRMSHFVSARVQLLAISCDPVFTLRAFADQAGIEFPLLSDFWPHGRVATAYDAFDATRGCARRSTVVVDGAGVVRWRVDNDLQDARDQDELAAVLSDMAGESDTEQ